MKHWREDRGDDYYARRAHEGHEEEEKQEKIDLYCRVISENFTPKYKYFPRGAARDNDLSVELSLWRALWVLILFRILSDWSRSNAFIDSMDWSVLNTLCFLLPCQQRCWIA